MSTFCFVGLACVADALEDGEDRQVIKDTDGSSPRAKIRACSISDPYILIFREDDTIGLFVAADARRIRRKDMSPMGEKVFSLRTLSHLLVVDDTSQ